MNFPFVCISEDSKGPIHRFVRYTVFVLLCFCALPGCARESDANPLGVDKREIALRQIHDLRVSSQVIARLADESVEGYAPSFDRLISERKLMEDALNLFGDSKVLGECAAYPEIIATLNRLRANADSIIDARTDVLAMSEASDRFRSAAIDLSKSVDALIPLMRDSGSSPSQLVIAGRQHILAERMAWRMEEIRVGAPQLDSLARDSSLFKMILDGYRLGKPEMGVTKLPTEAQGHLDAVEASFKRMSEAGEDVKRFAPRVFQARSSAEFLSGDAIVFLEQANVLAELIYSSHVGLPCSVH